MDLNTILCEADSVRIFGKCHLAKTKLCVPERRGIDLKTGVAFGKMNLDFSPEDCFEQEVWVIRIDLKDNGSCSGCNVTHARNEQEAWAAWRNFLGLRYQVIFQDPGIFIYVDGKEVMYWDTSDTSHPQQAMEIAYLFHILYEKGPDAFLNSLESRK